MTNGDDEAAGSIIEDKRDERNSNKKDFVIREGFPALYLPGGSSPWIEGTEPLPRHRFWGDERAFQFNLYHLENCLWDDCAKVFSARTRDEDEAYSAGATFFCPCNMEPRCALEALALSIFKKHTQHLEKGVVIPEMSGAEWWTLVLDVEDERKRVSDGDEKKNSSENEDEEEEDNEVGLHFDADYGLEDQCPNLLLHPRLATVTYLTDFGAPTVVLDKRSPPPNDPEKKTLEGNIRKGWLSHPKIGKHIAFDGRLLHGAPATFFNSGDKEMTTSSEPPNKKTKQDRKRITFMVNVWVNHCPLDAELLDDDVCLQLKTPLNAINSDDSEADKTKKEFSSPAFLWNDDVDLAAPVTSSKASLALAESDPAGEEEVVICNRIVTAKFGASQKDLCQATGMGGFVELDFDKGVVSLDVGEEVQSDDGGDCDASNGSDAGEGE